jgi:hypothetical protein
VWWPFAWAKSKNKKEMPQHSYATHKTPKLMTHLGFVPTLDYENVWCSVSQKPTLYTAVQTEATRQAVLTHMFLRTHAHDHLLAFFMQNDHLLSQIAADIDSKLSSSSAGKYVNFLRLKGLIRYPRLSKSSIKLPASKRHLLTPKQSQRAARLLQILVHFCQFAIDSEDKEEAFLVKKVEHINYKTFFEQQIKPSLGRSNVFEREIQALFTQPVQATMVQAAELMCPSEKDIHCMLAKHATALHA